MVKSTSSNRKTPFARAMRSIIGIAVLSALVLSITLGVRATYNLDALQLVHFSDSLLAKIGVPAGKVPVGEVAGKFVERISQTDLGSGVSTSRVSEASASTTTKVVANSGKSASNINDAKLRIAVFSDIHEDAQNLAKALDEVIRTNVAAIFILGDLTNYGDVTTLEKVKDQLNASGVTYYAIPGDHDIAQTSDTSNFKQVFGATYQKVAYSGFTFLLIDNDMNFTKIPANEISWIENNIKGADFVLLSQPLYTQGLAYPQSKMYMGSTYNTPESQDLLTKQQDVADQGALLLKLIQDTPSVKAIIAGDHHKFSELTDPVRSNLVHYAVGPLTSTREQNVPQSVTQVSRYTLLGIFDDGAYKLQDLAIE